MFITVRLVISILITIFMNFIFKKRCFKEKNKSFKILSNIIMVCCVVFALSFCPFENLILTFNTPEKVFKYVNPKVHEVSLVVPGSESDLLVAEDNNSYFYLIVPKNNEGWKLGITHNTKRISQKIHNDNVIYVYQYADTNEFFVTVSNVNGGYISINDICSSKFYSLEQERKSLSKTYVVYFASISNYDSNYTITIDGESINV